jgi:hypothetical protein
MEGDRSPPVKPFLHSVNESTLFIVLILIVRLGVLLQIAVVFRWMVFVLLGDARHHLILSLYVRVNVGHVGIRAGSPRLALLIEAAVAVGAIAGGVGRRLRRAVLSLAARHAEPIGRCRRWYKEEGRVEVVGKEDSDSSDQRTQVLVLLEVQDIVSWTWVRAETEECSGGLEEKKGREAIRRNIRGAMSREAMEGIYILMAYLVVK